MVQSVKRLTSVHVIISWLVDSRPTLSSELIAQGLEPALDSGSPSPSAPPSLMLYLSLKKEINIKKSYLIIYKL